MTEEMLTSLSALCRVAKMEELVEALIGLHFWTVSLPDGLCSLQSPACQHRDHQGPSRRHSAGETPYNELGCRQTTCGRGRWTLLIGPVDVDGGGVAGTTAGSWEVGGVACSWRTVRSTLSMVVQRYSRHESLLYRRGLDVLLLPALFGLVIPSQV
jgi:hypothetical protein